MYAQCFAHVSILAANCRHHHSCTLGRIHSVLQRVRLIQLFLHYIIAATKTSILQGGDYGGKPLGKRIGHPLQSIAHSKACRPPSFVRRDPVHLPLISLRQLLMPGMGLTQHILHKQDQLGP